MSDDYRLYTSLHRTMCGIENEMLKKFNIIIDKLEKIEMRLNEIECDSNKNNKSFSLNNAEIMKPFDLENFESLNK